MSTDTLALDDEMISQAGVIPRLHQHRNHRLKLAVLASIGSKVATVILHVLVMPMVMRALGPERFGVFLMIGTSLMWISSTSIGLGNAIVICISRAVAADDRTLQSRAVSSAFYTVLTISSILVLAISMVYTRYGVQTLFGPQYSAYQADINTGLWLVIGFMIMALILDVFEGAQSGYQENYIVNLAGMAGQTVSAISLLVMLYWHRMSIVTVIVCAYVLALVPRLINAILHIACIRPQLLPRLRHCSYIVLRGLLITGMAFSAMAIGQFLKHECGILLVGRLLGPVAIATYGICANIMLLAFGIITMQLRPLLPALADARARCDLDWILRTSARLRMYIMGYAVLVGIGMMLLGSTIISLLYGPQVAPGTRLQIAIGVSFILQSWELYHYTMLMGLHYIWPAVILCLCQNMLMIVLAVPLIMWFGSAGAALAVCISIMLLGLWLLPLMLRRALRAKS